MTPRELETQKSALALMVKIGLVKKGWTFALSRVPHKRISADVYLQNGQS